MGSYIRTVRTASGATAVQIEHKAGRRRVGIEHVGSAHTDAELAALKAEARRRLNEGQMVLPLFPGEPPAVRAVSSRSRLLYDALAHVYHDLGLDSLADATFRDLVVARIVEPASKLDSIRVLEGLGIDAPSYQAIRTALGRCARRDYRERVQRELLAHARPDALTLLLYDVTTLHFEVHEEDGYRMSGFSKERRLEPQVVVGLLTGRDGFPLEVRSFEGNRAEVKTVMEVLSSFRARYGEGPVTVTADAGMLSARNAGELERAGYHYIIGSRVSKAPFEVVEFELRTGEEPADGQLFDTWQEFTIDGRGARRRVVYQWRRKRAQRDLRNIEKTLEKAERMASGKAGRKRNRFLKEGGEPSVDYDLVESARLRAGIKGYVTDLPRELVPPGEVVDAYHELFEVERSFRMSKSDLRARPVFHHKRDSIEAHLTVVLAALAVSREVQRRTGTTIRNFRHALEPLRTCVISVNGTLMEAPPAIEGRARELLDAIGFPGK